MENYENWIFINPETYVEDEVNSALERILTEYSRFLELDSNISILAYSEREKTKKFFEKVVDQSVYFNPDSLKLRRYFIDWYASHRTEITKAKQSSDLYLLTNEELNEFMLSYGFPYPRHIISRGNRIQFLSNLINNYKKKGTSEAIANIVSLYGLRNVNISEWWIRYDKRREKPYFAKSNVIHPENLRSDKSLEIEKSYDEFILNNPHWQMTYDELHNEFIKPNNLISLPSITNIVSIETHSNLTEMELAAAVYQRKLAETLDFWISYSLNPIKKPGLDDFTIITSMLNDPPSQEYLTADLHPTYSNLTNSTKPHGNDNIYLVGPNPTGGWVGFEKKLVKYVYDSDNPTSSTWEVVNPNTRDKWSLFLRSDSVQHTDSLLIYDFETSNWKVFGKFGKDACLNTVSNHLGSRAVKSTIVYNGSVWIDLGRDIHKRYYLNRNENVFRDVPLNNFPTLYSVAEIILAFAYLHDGPYQKFSSQRHIYYNGDHSPLDSSYVESWSTTPPPVRNDIDAFFYADEGYGKIATEYKNLVFDEDKLTPDNSIVTFRHDTTNLNTPKLLQEAKKKVFYNKFTKRNNYIDGRSHLHAQTKAGEYLAAMNPDFIAQINELVQSDTRELVLENMMIDFENYVMNTMLLIDTPFAYIQNGGQFFNKKLLPVLDFFKPFRVKLLDFLTKFDISNPLMDSMIPDELIKDFHIDETFVEKPFPRNITTPFYPDDTEESKTMYIPAPGEGDPDLIPVLDYSMGHGLATEDYDFQHIIHTVNEPSYSPLDKDLNYSSLDLSMKDAFFITVTEGGDEIFYYRTDDGSVLHDVDGTEVEIIPE